MRIETRVVFSDVVSADVIDWGKPHFLCCDNLEIKKSTITNIDTAYQFLNAFILRHNQSILIADKNIILKDFIINPGATFDIGFFAGHCLSIGDRLFFKSTIADKLILNISGIAYREDL
jgi:hypothetical protein